jgi:putative oxidoreductase
MHPFALLLLRLGFGGMLLFGHGLPKLMTYSEKSSHFPDPVGLGSSLSLIATITTQVPLPLLVMAGLFTRWACGPIVFMLVVAAFVIHGGDPWNKKELALVYAVPFLAILIAGPGKYSLDAKYHKSSPWV